MKRILMAMAIMVASGAGAQNVALITDTNGVLKAPLKFFGANSNTLNSVVNRTNQSYKHIDVFGDGTGIGLEVISNAGDTNWTFGSTGLLGYDGGDLDVNIQSDGTAIFNGRLTSATGFTGDAAQLTGANATTLFGSGTVPFARTGSLSNHTDVKITGLTSGQILAWDNAQGKYTNGPPSNPVGNAGALTNILRGFITPFECGAVGDGVTDDSAALKKWLFIGCSSNWICFLPPAPGGSYACSTTLQITNGMNDINIQGTGGAVFNSDGPNQNFALIKITTAVDGLVITNVPSNFKIEGIRLTNSAAYSFATHGIWVNGNNGDSDCSSVRNCSAQGFGRGLLLSSVADTEVENCPFGANGMGIEIAGGTYANPPIINQVRIIGCQLSYNYTNQLHITNAGQYVFVQTCDMAAQAGAVGATVMIERNAYVTLSDMHLEPYNGKPGIIATDNGGGAGGTFLNLYNVSCSADGTALGANTYSLIATNANVTLMNVGLSDIADGSFSILWNGDVNTFTSDKSILSRIVGGSNVATNYLGGNFIRAKNSGVVATYIREGELLREFADFNSNPGGGIGGGYILSRLYFGARGWDYNGNLGVTPVELTGYYYDTAASGTGIRSTNGFSVGSTTVPKWSVGSAGVTTNAGLVINSNTVYIAPIKGDISTMNSNGALFVVMGKPNGQLQTNLIARYWDNDVQTFFDVAGSTVTNNPVICAAIQQLVDEYKQNGWWTTTDMIYPLVGNSNACRLNLKARSLDLTFNSASGFTFNYWGVKGDGTGYADTGFNPSSAGGQFALNGAHLFCAIGTQATAGTEVFLGGYQNGDPRAYLQYNAATVVRGVGLNCAGSAGDVATDDGLGRGGFLVTRTASNLTTSYRRSFAPVTSVTASSALPNCNLLVWARGTGTSPSFDNQSLIQMRGVSIGGAVTDGAAFLAMWDRFNRALGRTIME